jgi:hypothetical protein
MMRAFKILVILALLGFVGLTGYAYLGDLTPTTVETRAPVTLNGG